MLCGSLNLIMYMLVRALVGTLFIRDQVCEFSHANKIAI